ncbi:MAG: lipopolysaccharide heptosyltransferase I [Sulfuricurvum sp.]
MEKQNLRIAIVRLSALGDIINTAVVLQIIHAYYPNALIDWFVEEAFAPILKNHPLIHEVIPIPLKRLKKTKSFFLLKEMIHTLKSREHYDHIIDAQGLLKSAIIASFLPGKVHGFDSRSAREGIASWFYATTSSIPYEISVVRRNVMVITETLNIPYTDALIEKKSPVFFSKLIPHKNKKIALVIGASWASKCYPKEQFAALCDLLPYPCHLIWGSASEYDHALWIQEHSKNAIITPKMSLKELVDFIANCTLTIGNDTGPTHIAWAMNAPSITLFGPTNERMIYPTPINIGLKSPSEVDICHINRNDFSIHQIDPHLIATQAKELL